MEYDSTAGIYYDHARYYDAAIGRSMSRDPKGFGAGDRNLYQNILARQPPSTTSVAPVM